MKVGYTFKITVRHIGWIHLVVVKIRETPSFEFFEVCAKNRSLIIKGNRPILKQMNLKSKPIKWQLIEGTLTNIDLLEKICKLIDVEVRKSDRYSP